MSRFCFVYTIGFVLRDPKLNYVQLPGFVEKRAKYLIVRRQVVLKRSAVFYFCLARHKIEQSSISPVCTRAFVREKLPQETVISYNPEKPPGGRFFCCRSIIPVSKRQRSASLAVRRGNSEAYSRYAPPKGTAKRIPAVLPHIQRNSAVPFPLPFPRTHKKARENSLAFFACGCTPECNFSPKTGYR